ncbi:MAG: FdrA family protein [Clostridiales bacterium]|nr:FdrA family protein [Clostridiales bacterium]
MKRVYLAKNRYVDSVTLMGVAERILGREGITGAESGMGTPANVELLTSLGYRVPEDTCRNDMMLALDAEDEEALEAAHRAGMEMLDHPGGRQQVLRDLRDLELGQFDIAQISLPGEYAAAEARKAIELGMDVFIFSDNVPLSQERELKEFGRTRGKLVMGPDAGVGLMGGVALAAGSIVRKGAVGIVAASGSGAQEVACLIERLGAGVSAIIGAGGHDLLPGIGGITMRMGMERLDNDPDTQVICLVSKLADRGVMAKVLTDADRLSKPVVAMFLGGGEEIFQGSRVRGAFSLQEAAELCCELLTGEKRHLGWGPDEVDRLAEDLLKGITPPRKYFRGLYCGGTFAEEALLLFARENPQVKLYSNINTPYTQKLPSHHQSIGHTLVDLGAEDFTAEAPHPVFDPSLRLRRLERELEDPQAAVILLDFITGPGVHPDPILPFVRMVRQHRDVIFIATICGAQGDPQNITQARKALEEAGVIMADSNQLSARLASALMAALERRR